MKNLILAAVFSAGVCSAIEAAPTDTVTQADLQAIIMRLNKLEAENKAQAAKIAELEGKNKALLAQQTTTANQVAENGKKIAAVSTASATGKPEDGTTVSDSGRIFTTKQGFKYYLADKGAKIFEPLSESGLKLTPYGYLVFEATHNTRGSCGEYCADWVNKKGDGDGHTSTFSVQDSILGLQFETPEKHAGWTFTGRAEFDLVDTTNCDANHYGFHWRHLYVDAKHDSGWSVLFGQTWHLWKMVSPSEIDGAWMENTGHPYRRSPQIRVTKKWDIDTKSSLEWRIGMVKNGPGMGGDRDSDRLQDNSASVWPLFESTLMYDRDAAWEKADSGKRWLVGIGGMYGRDRSHRPDSYTYDAEGNPTGYNSYNGDTDEYNSMMIMVAGKVPYRDFTLTGQFFAGENLGGVQAGCGQCVGYNELNQKGSEVRTIGGFLDLTYQLNETWSFAIGYGMDNPNNSDAKKADGILFNDRAYVDAFYQVTDNLKFGLEYARLSTDWKDDGSKYNDRIQFTAFYDF